MDLGQHALGASCAKHSAVACASSARAYHYRFGERRFAEIGLILWGGITFMKRLTKRGQHTVLPIGGDILSEMIFSADRLPVLVFRGMEEESQVKIQDQIVLLHGSAEQMLPHSQPGASFDPERLKPVLDLLGLRVSDALALKDGTLQIEFEGSFMLKVTSTTGYEAWHFQLPRPGRPASRSGHQVSLHGTAGHLI